MFTLEQLARIFGDSRHGDLLEQVAFNLLAASNDPRMLAHQYHQQANQVVVSFANRDWSFSGPDANVFGFEPHFGCCTANLHQGWPKFVRITLSIQQPAEFGVALRIPAWCDAATLTVAGESVPGPLVMVHGIEEIWRPVPDHEGLAEWEIIPRSMWNCGVWLDDPAGLDSWPRSSYMAREPCCVTGSCWTTRPVLSPTVRRARSCRSCRYACCHTGQHASESPSYRPSCTAQTNTKASIIGTGVAILIDATLVRGVLVPAGMQVLGRAAWWAPRPLRRLHDRVGLREAPGAQPIADGRRTWHSSLGMHRLLGAARGG